MKTERIAHDLVQGTPAWHAFRLDHDGASEAAAMLGLSPYSTRADLMKQKATGLIPEVDEGTQRLFDAGHAAEADARALAEAILVDDLYPATYSYGRMSASVDGLTMDGTTAFEHKLWNAELAAAVKRGELPDAYQPQCQQVMMVTGAERVLFMVSDGTLANCVHMLVRPHAKWMDRIKAGWAMFNQDRDHYQYAEVLPAAAAVPTMQLPALSIQVTGSIALVDNLKVFGERLAAFIDGLDKNPSDDQAFANAEAAIKTLGTAETALEAAKSSALAQTASIDEMTRTVALYAGQARTTRLMLEKLVKVRKESIRVEIVQGGKDALAAHIAGLNKRLGKPYMPVIAADFAGVIKGKKTVASLKDAVATELARVKIEASETADRIAININTLREHAEAHKFLFADTAQIVLKQCGDFLALVKTRIADHAAAEAKRLEAERERIRAEEVEKLAREQAERIAKEQAAAHVSTQPPKAGSPELEPRHASAAAQKRPTDDQIIDAISLAFRVHESKAIEWLLDLDLDAASERLAKQFA